MEKIEFLNFNYTHIEFNNIQEINKVKDDHTTVLKRRTNELILEIIPKETSKIEQTKFEIYVSNKTLGLNQGYWYSIRDAKSNLTVTPNQFPAEAVKNYKFYGATTGEISKYSTTATEVGTVAEVVFGLGNSGALMNFSQTLKLLSKFRFISVYYGALLEPFLAAGGAAIEPKSS